MRMVKQTLLPRWCRGDRQPERSA